MGGKMCQAFISQKAGYFIDGLFVVLEHVLSDLHTACIDVIADGALVYDLKIFFEIVVIGTQPQ